MSLFQTILSDLEAKLHKKNSHNEKIALIVSAILHTTIAADQISLRDTTLQIKAPATVKMAITLNRGKLLAQLKEAGVEVTVIK